MDRILLTLHVNECYPCHEIYYHFLLINNTLLSFPSSVIVFTLPGKSNVVPAYSIYACAYVCVCLSVSVYVFMCM